ncbi:MBL fold metallo-hydrolase [Bradyrhizobium sp. TZ2]
MRPSLHPSLVNGRSGDPALYIETLFERRAILFDLGDISVLPPRKLLRLEYVFVSHAHVDHFIGFDYLLRLLVGRDTTVRLYGPEGFAAQVHHKLQAYQWNLVDRFENDLVFLVTELNSSLRMNTVRFPPEERFCGRAGQRTSKVQQRALRPVDISRLDRDAGTRHPVPCICDRGSRPRQRLEKSPERTGAARRTLVARSQACRH